MDFVKEFYESDFIQMEFMGKSILENFSSRSYSYILYHQYSFRNI